MRVRLTKCGARLVRGTFATLMRSKSMKYAVGIMAGAALLALFTARAVALPSDSPWFVGFWKMTADEDGTPSDTMEFRADGTYVNYGYKCVASSAKYHLYSQDIYVTVEIEGKGPVAIIFRPSSDKKRLT